MRVSTNRPVARPHLRRARERPTERREGDVCVCVCLSVMEGAVRVLSCAHLSVGLDTVRLKVDAGNVSLCSNEVREKGA